MGDYLERRLGTGMRNPEIENFSNIPGIEHKCEYLNLPGTSVRKRHLKSCNLEFEK